jgi:hypothetical protein
MTLSQLLQNTSSWELGLYMARDRMEGEEQQKSALLAKAKAQRKR